MKNNKFLHVLMIFVVLFSSLALSAAVTTSSLVDAASSIRYATPEGLITGGCLSWEAACTLPHALELAVSEDEIWVMEGIYYPGVVPTDTFHLKHGVALYGGFPAGGGGWDQRNWLTYLTILSGDIDQNDIAEGGVVTDTVNITGTNAYHVVTNEALNTAILNGFIITAGNTYPNSNIMSDGGGLSNSGNITLAHVTFSGNIANFGGGMINAGDTATLTDITFTGNKARMGGGIYNDNSSAVQLVGVDFNSNQAGFTGGGMHNNGDATLTNVTFSSNQAGFAGGGLSNNGDARLTDVTFSSNQARVDGGGMVNSTNSNTTLTDVSFTSNTAGMDGGALYNGHGTINLTHVTFSGNSAIDEWARGGGLVNRDGKAILMDVIFESNQASAGGGIYNENGYLAITGGTLSSNYGSEQGGGMTNGGVAILEDVTFSGNQADLYAGGINSGNPITLTNVTISNNIAPESGGLNNMGAATLTNVTFYGNQAFQEAGGMTNHGSAILTNCILWGNTTPQITGNIPSVTYSDIQGGWGGVGNINADPLLGPLADNGGSTLTHALGAGSPAIDTASPITCPRTDQRGYVRPFDGDGNGVAVSDMGAFDLGHIPTSLSHGCTYRWWKNNDEIVMGMSPRQAA